MASAPTTMLENLNMSPQSGHSTGGTLALLAAASSDKFAAILSRGPTAADYGKDRAPYEWTDEERSLRHPIEHLSSIKTPTYILEGDQGNSDSLAKLKKANKILTFTSSQSTMRITSTSFTQSML